MDRKKGLLKISQLAKKAGVSIPTVKHYLREGLLPRPVKTSRNMAYYSEVCVERIRSIKKIQKEKFLPLDVIKRLIDSGESFDEELALGKAILKTGSLETGRTPLPRSRIEKTTGCPLDKIDMLEGQNLIHPETAGASKSYHCEDVELIRIMQARDAMGVPTDASLTTLSIYGEAMTRAVGEDINFFIRNITGDTATHKIIRFITEADETLDRFVILFRRKMMRRTSEKIIRSLNRIPRELAFLNILPGPVCGLPDRPPQNPVENRIYHLLKGERPTQNEESRAGNGSRHRCLKALSILNDLFSGHADQALKRIGDTIPKPSFHSFENMAAALTYLYSFEATTGLSAPMFAIKKVFAHLQRIEQQKSRNTLIELFPLYVCGAVYIFLPGVFNTRQKGIEILGGLKETLKNLSLDKEELPEWLSVVLRYELLPAFDIRLNRYLAQGYLKTGQDRRALDCLESVIDTADADSDLAAWAKLERMKIMR
jgi:DNA-binding transcriptional MerR regulator